MTPAVIPQVVQFRPHPGTPVWRDLAQRAWLGRTVPAGVFRYVDRSDRPIGAVRGGHQQ